MIAETAHTADALYGVDVRLVSSEGLSGLAAADIPKLRSRVTRARHEDILVGTKRQTAQHFSNRLPTSHNRRTS